MNAVARHRTLPTLVLLLMCLGLAHTAAAQEETLDVRLERTAGIQPDAAKAFYDALRGSVGRSEQAAACALLAYPLQHASGVVADAAACVARYDTLFTIPVRRAIGRQRYEELFINDSGVMLGVGEVWFRCLTKPCASRDTVRVTALNSDAASLPPPKGKVLLACQVSARRSACRPMAMAARRLGCGTRHASRARRNASSPGPHRPDRPPPAARAPGSSRTMCAPTRCLNCRATRTCRRHPWGRWGA